MRTLKMTMMMTVAVFGLGCGTLGGLGKGLGGATGVGTQKDYVAEAEKHMLGLKADYVLLMGVQQTVDQKADLFTRVPDGLKFLQVNWKQFEGELTSCWNTPIETIQSVKGSSVDAIEAGKAYRSNGVYHDLKSVQLTAQNGIDRVKQCPGVLAAEVKGFPKKTADTAKAWAQERLKILNDLRVLIKQEVPDRAKAVGNRVLDTPTQIGGVLAEAQGAFEVLKKNPLANDGDRAKMQGQLDTLKRMQGEAQDLGNTVQRDAMVIPGKSAETGTKLVNNFKTIGRKK